jgi:hypothetical protein
MLVFYLQFLQLFHLKNLVDSAETPANLFKIASCNIPKSADFSNENKKQTPRLKGACCD